MIELPKATKVTKVTKVTIVMRERDRRVSLPERAAYSMAVYSRADRVFRAR